MTPIRAPGVGVGPGADSIDRSKRGYFMWYAAVPPADSNTIADELHTAREQDTLLHEGITA
eukprot:scaffold397165_cov50-Attheya_sp.AAC.1